MTCTCAHNCAFRWADSARESIFARDPAFTTGAKTGKTASQISSAIADAYTARTGLSMGSIRGLSAKGNLQIEESENKRRAKA